MPVEQRLSAGIADDLRRAVRIARHGKILGFDLSRASSRGNSFAHASFAAKRAARLALRADPVAAVGEFLRREDPRNLACACLGKQAIDARDLDRIDAATRRCAGRLFGGITIELRGANDQRGVGSRKATAQDQRGIPAWLLRRCGNADAGAIRIGMRQRRDSGNHVSAQGRQLQAPSR